MRTFFARANSEIPVNQSIADNRKSVEHTSLPYHRFRPGAQFIQLEIQAIALQRLIIENRLAIEELHCPDKISKGIIQKALLDSLIGTTAE